MTALIAPVGHLTCRHRDYGLSCEAYDELYADSAGRCGICGIKEAFAPQGILYIDHDHKLGNGSASIRGLLCNRCNTGIDRPTNPLSGPDVEAYLSCPWHARRRKSHYQMETTGCETVAQTLARVGAQYRRLRHLRQAGTSDGLHFSQSQLWPTVRAARRSGMTARQVSAEIGCTVEHIWKRWGPLPSDPDWLDQAVKDITPRTGQSDN
jgi:hypothetical protein